MPMEPRPLCPLLTAGAQIPAGVYCELEMCSWWDEKREKCAILVMAQNIAKLNEDGIETF